MTVKLFSDMTPKERWEIVYRAYLASATPSDKVNAAAVAVNLWQLMLRLTLPGDSQRPLYAEELRKARIALASALTIRDTPSANEAERLRWAALTDEEQESESVAWWL